MKELVLKLIEQETTLLEIATATGKSEKQIGFFMNMLKNGGYAIAAKYDDHGNIRYYFRNGLSNNNIVIEPKGSSVRALMLADLHVGIDNNGLKFMPEIIEYMGQHNINVACILGDLFDGVIGYNKDTQLSVDKQLELFFKEFPYQTGIIFPTLFGNHDYSILRDKHLDVRNRLAVRPDIIDLGYGIGRIYIGNELIGLKHDLVLQKQEQSLDDARLIFSGHSHRFEITGNTIVTPALLNVAFSNKMLGCGFLDVTFNLNQEQYVDSIKIKHIVITDQFIPFYEIYMELGGSKVKKKI